jgi:hypothetical protein
MRKLVTLLLVAVAAACGGAGSSTPARSPLADKWLARAKQSYRSGDFEDAKQAVESALQAAPSDAEARTLGARIALVSLNFADAIKYTQDMQTAEAHGIRGRAFWYSGDIEAAADELEAMLQDPSVKDPWAREIAKLARRGHGRHPFHVEGGIVEAVEMPKVQVPAMVVPCEIEGERVLALVATAVGEVVVDSSTRREGAWINLRFGQNIEVYDVPALAQDLSSISRQVNAPIKALLGVNLLRHLHATFDRRGDQFVVRRSEPPPPPDASRVPLWYVRGGGTLVRTQISPKEDGHATMLLDSATFTPLALPDATYKRAGVDPTKVKMDSAINAKAGILPTLRLGGVDLPQLPFVEGGAPFEEVQRGVDIDLAGIVGAGLLALFRVTFADSGKSIWLEPDPLLLEPPSRGRDAAQGPPMEPDDADGKPPAKAEPKSEPKTEPKAPAKPDAKPAPTPEQKPDTKKAPEKAPEKKDASTPGAKK